MGGISQPPITPIPGQTLAENLQLYLSATNKLYNNSNLSIAPWQITGPVIVTPFLGGYAPNGLQEINNLNTGTGGSVFQTSPSVIGGLTLYYASCWIRRETLSGSVAFYMKMYNGGIPLLGQITIDAGTGRITNASLTNPNTGLPVNTPFFIKATQINIGGFVSQEFHNYWTNYIIGFTNNASLNVNADVGFVLNGSCSVDVWGVQLEQDNATPNIPTAGAQVTRRAGVLPTWVLDMAGIAAATGANFTPISNSLVADVPLAVAANYFDGPVIAQGAVGTWNVSGNVTVSDSAGSQRFYAKLWDGFTVYASGTAVTSGANNETVISLSAVCNPTASLKISVREPGATTGKIAYNASGNIKDSSISAIRIA